MGFLRRGFDTIVGLLRQGITPEKIAMAVALSVALGVFPVLGTTTLLCAAAATLLGLNLPAMQLVGWLVYPLQLVLLVPLMRLGSRLFGLVAVPPLTELLKMMTHDLWGTDADILACHVDGRGGVAPAESTAGVWGVLAAAASIAPIRTQIGACMMLSWIGLLLWGTGAVAAMMFVLWLIHLPLHNAAIVDFGWALGLAILGVGYAVFGGGWWLRAVLLGSMTAVWGLRLALYLLFTRIIGHPEEGRYQELRRKWKTNIPAKFLAFFEFQALLDVFLSVPFLLAARNQNPELSTWEWIGVGIWVVAIVGEIFADAQLAAFKSRPESKGHTCKVGLWRYSRHPNYFFEWLIWMSYAVFALASPYGFLGFVSPALILFFLLRVTGIPATEEQALRSRGEEYRRYQRETSAFIPWFPKES